MFIILFIISDFKYNEAKLLNTAFNPIKEIKSHIILTKTIIKKKIVIFFFDFFISSPDIELS